MATITTGNTPKALQGASSMARPTSTASKTAMPTLPGKTASAPGKPSIAAPAADLAKTLMSRLASAGTASTPMEQEKTRTKTSPAATMGQDDTATHNDGGFAYHDGRPLAHYGG